MGSVDELLHRILHFGASDPETLLFPTSLSLHSKRFSALNLDLTSFLTVLVKSCFEEDVSGSEGSISPLGLQDRGSHGYDWLLSGTWHEGGAVWLVCEMSIGCSPFRWYLTFPDTEA